MVFADALGFLLLLGATVVVGYVGGALYTRTRIPDAVWLLLFGLIVGPGLGLVDRAAFLALAPLLSTVALLIILFDSGLHLNFYETLKNFPRGSALAVSNVALGILGMGLVGMAFGLPWEAGLLLGAILGETATPVVQALTQRLRVKKEAKQVLELESIVNDPLTIVVAIALVNLLAAGATAVGNPVAALLAAFSVGAVLGVIAGLVWLGMLDRLRGRPYGHMLTLAIAFLLYAGAEWSGGSGPVAALAFGLVLGNGKTFSRMLKLGKQFAVDKDMAKFQDEITFFIKAFFFVFLGMIVAIQASSIAFGLAAAAALLGLRLLGTKLALLGSGFGSLEQKLCMVTAPRGLSAAVLSLLPAAAGVPNGEIFAEVAFVVILTTVLYSTALGWWLSTKTGLLVSEQELERRVAGQKKVSLREEPPAKTN